MAVDPSNLGKFTLREPHPFVYAALTWEAKKFGEFHVDTMLGRKDFRFQRRPKPAERWTFVSVGFAEMAEMQNVLRF